MKRFKTALILLLIFALCLSIYACGQTELKTGKEAYLERLDEISEKVYDSVIVTGNYYDELVNLELTFDSKLNGYTVEGIESEIEQIANTHANYFKDYEENDDILFQTDDAFIIQVTVENGNAMYIFDKNGNITLYALASGEDTGVISLTFQYK